MGREKAMAKHLFWSMVLLLAVHGCIYDRFVGQTQRSEGEGREGGIQTTQVGEKSKEGRPQRRDTTSHAGTAHTTDRHINKNEALYRHYSVGNAVLVNPQVKKKFNTKRI